MTITDYQAKFFAYALTREGGKGVERLQQSLLNASVDLNPHQVEAALFALRSPISKGVLLADEVGLGKTIEAGLVMCQLWAERKRKILVVCPASLRKQWQVELEEKFNLPSVVVDAKSVRELQKEGYENPYSKCAVLISSYPFAARNAENLRKLQWDLVVMDEAHKLRNAYRESNRVGQALRWALENRRKILLTATPLQNALTELYGIATLLDDTYFGDLPSFRSRYANAGGDLDGLKDRLSEFCWRTLRKDVEAFVKYTKRFPITESFECTDRENSLYTDVSAYLQDETTYAFPQSQRAMLTLLVRKVQASSTVALAGTLEMILARLKNLTTLTGVPSQSLLANLFEDDPDIVEQLSEELDEDLLALNVAENVSEYNRARVEQTRHRRLAQLLDEMYVDFSEFLLGEELPVDILNAWTGEVIIPRNRKITKSLVLNLTEAYDRLSEVECEEIQARISVVLEKYALRIAELDRIEAVVHESRDEIDPIKLAREIKLVTDFIRRAHEIGADKKTQHLLVALEKGWARLKELGAEEKAVVFTESRRTMNFLKEYLEAHGYAGQVVCFSGGGKKDVTAEAIYQRYKEAHPEDKSSKPVMMRHALIDAFRREAKILIATEAGAEGINLQFCSMVVNYDLPWNPQRVEQRIGRCHRYGQKCDVVVVNFLNTRNAADVRVYEILSHKFRLFEGLFGASNDILGVIDKEGKSFERRINEILQNCRTPDAINTAFDKLQKEFQDEIAARMEQTRQDILHNLDDDVRKLLKIDYDEAKSFLSEGEERFMMMTQHILGSRAQFEADDPRTFRLETPPTDTIAPGRYSLNRADLPAHVLAYRPNCELGEWVVAEAKARETPFTEVTFDISHYPGKISILESLKGMSGHLRLDRLSLKSLDQEDFLLFSAMTDDGRFLDPETAEKMFALASTQQVSPELPNDVVARLESNALQYASATASKVGEANNAHFKEATEKLFRWSEDQIAVATHKVETLRSRQLELERQIRHATTLDVQVPLQREFDAIRRDIRRARANIAVIEDETDEKRRRLLDALQRKLVPETQKETLFIIRWKII